VRRRREIIEQVAPTAAAAVAVLLTTFTLAPTLGEGPWFTPTLAVIAAVAVIGAGLRALAWPRALVILLQGLGLTLLITWIFAGDVATLSVLPGPEAWNEFRALAERGQDVVNREVAPITVTDGVQFLVVLGVGLIAWVVDAVAVTLRQATLAGIPLLALYLVPAVVLPDGVPWPLFVLAGVGWLLLLLTDGRRELLKWGRPVDGDAPGPLHAVGGTGRRLGAAALAVAVIVPVVLPSLDDGRFGFGSGDSDGSGPGSASASEQRVTTFNPITDLRRELRLGPDNLVLTYTTTAPTPDYLHVATLDAFDGFTWRLEELGANTDQLVADGIPVPAGLSDEVAQTSTTYDVTIDSLQGKRLPVPYPASLVDIAGDWRYDPDTLDVFTPASEDSLGADYTVTQRTITPTVEQLRGAGQPDTPDSSQTEIPDSTALVLGNLPLEITDGAASDYDRALMLQNWFRTKFAYSLDTVSGNDNDALKQFLQDRSGYCEQFAATMALMARALNIPARVVVGYTPGSETGDGVWQVTAHDAHAWPELWFEGIGWVRFEPTPGGGDGGATPIYAPPPQQQVTSNKPGSSRTINLRRGGGTIGQPHQRGALSPEERRINRGSGGFGVPSDQTTGAGDSGSPSRWWLLLAVLVVAAGAALAPIAAQRLTRRQRWKHPAPGRAAVEAAWADVLDAAVDVEIPAAKTDTPRDVAAHLPKRCRLSPPASADLKTLASLVERLRYSDAVVSVPDASRLHEMANGIRDEVYGSLASRDRRQVTWWPSSGRQVLVSVWNRLNESIADAMSTTSSKVSSTVTGWVRRRPRDVAPSAPRSGS
jgi:transglutaminase-like putative cysteine protease